jgi:hypothetical protein
MNAERKSHVASPSERTRRFGPWPWYLSAAQFVGLDVDLVDEIAGDLTEECAAHSAPKRTLMRAWSFGQIVRSLPHLALSTLQRGHRRERLHLIGTLGTMLLAASAVVAAVQMHVGPPARIGADHGFDSNDIVINNVEYVQLPVRAIDARGHAVVGAGVHYELVGGDRLDLSSNGAVACHARGDATVRASLVDLVSLLTVHCRSVTQIRTTSWIDFLPNDSPRTLAVEAIGTDGEVVTDLRGSVRLIDSKVANLGRGLLSPRGPGSSPLAISIGDARLSAIVIVHELVSRFDNLMPAQRDVAMPLRIGAGDTLSFAAAAGTMWVKWMPRGGSATPPSITAEGPGFCHLDSEAFFRWLPKGENGAHCYMSAGARIRVSRGTDGASAPTGAPRIERMCRSEPAHNA